MAKVYVVTSGDYSDYCIDGIFSNREAAEKRCATWDGCDDPNIEEYELEDGTNNVIDQVYRGLNFGMSYRSYDDNISVYWEMKYGTKPFHVQIRLSEKLTSINNKKIELYHGTIPVNKTITDDKEAEKIIYDRIAKWKAERIGL